MSGSSRPTMGEKAHQFRRGAVTGDEPIHSYTRTLQDMNGSIYVNIPRRVAEAWDLEEGDDIEFCEFFDRGEVRPVE